MSSVTDLEIRSRQPTRAESAGKQVDDINSAFRRKICLAFGHAGDLPLFGVWTERHYRKRWDYSGNLAHTYTTTAILRGEETSIEIAGEYAGVYEDDGGDTFSREDETFEDTRVIEGGLVLNAEVTQYQDGSSTPEVVATATELVSPLAFYRPNLLSSHFHRVVGHGFIRGGGLVYREGMTVPGLDDGIGTIKPISVDLTGSGVDFDRPIRIELSWKSYHSDDTGLTGRPVFIDAWASELPSDDEDNPIPYDDLMNVFLVGFSAWGISQ